MKTITFVANFFTVYCVNSVYARAQEMYVLVLGIYRFISLLLKDDVTYNTFRIICEIGMQTRCVLLLMSVASIPRVLETSLGNITRLDSILKATFVESVFAISDENEMVGDYTEVCCIFEQVCLLWFD